MRAKSSISYLLNDDSCIAEKYTKPLRKRIGEHQIKELKKIFDGGIQFPNRQLREYLGQILSLAPRTIQVWFQNRRQTFKCTNEIQNDLQMISILQSLRNAQK